MNMHGNHVASCLCCKHLNFEEEQRWSEVTIDEAHWICLKGHFSYLTGDESELHDEFARGQECPDFKGR